MSASEPRAHFKEPPLGGESEPGLAPCEEDEGTDQGRRRRASLDLYSSPQIHRRLRRETSLSF